MSAALLAAVLGIALVDSLNPTLFISQLFLLTTPRPVARVSSWILGVVVVNFVGGLLILTGFRAVVARFVGGIDENVLAGLLTVAGLGLLVFGLRVSPKGDDVGAPTSSRSLHPVATFGLGMLVMLNEITTALPYFVAIERIAAASLGAVGNLVVLGLYNLVFALPLLGFLGAFVVSRRRMAERVDRVNRAVQRWVPRLLRYGALAFGAVLAVYGLVELLRG